MKNKFFYSFISYYILILLIPVIVIISLCISGIRIIRNEAIAANSIILETLSSDIDNTLISLDEFSILLQVDDDLFTLLHSFDDFTAEDRYELSTSLASLATDLATSSSVYNFLFYMSDYDYMVHSSGYTDVSDSNAYILQTLFGNALSYEMIIDEDFPLIYTTYTNSNTQVFYNAPLYHTFEYSSSDKLILQTNPNIFTNLVASGQEHTVYFFILDNNNTVLYTNNYNLMDSIDFTTIKYDDFTSIYHRNDYYAYHKKSTIHNNLSYVAFVSSNEINTSINLLYFIILISVIIMIIAIFFVLKLIKKNCYLPLYHTISIFESDYTSIKDSYAFLQDNVSKLVAEKESFESRKEYLQNYFILRTLNEKIVDATEYKELLQYYQIHFHYDNFRVLTFYTTGDVLADNEKQVILKIMEGLTAAFDYQANTYSVYINNMFTIIMNYEQITSPTSKMLETLYFYKELLLEHDIVLALSRKKTSFLDLNTAYNESIKAVEQCLIDGSNVKEYQEYLRNKNSDDVRYYNHELNFRLSIEEHNREKAKLILNKILLILKKEYADNPNIMRYKLYALFNILVSEFIKNNNHDAISTLYGNLETISTVDELIKYIDSVLELTLPNLPDETPDTDDFVAPIEEFILANIYKNELSVSLIAYEFHIDISILSKKFKKAKGVNPSDYIHELRITKSKEFLANDSIRIQDIAEQCGYLNADTFIRIFKRYEGITPGKYRKNKSNRTN